MSKSVRDKVDYVVYCVNEFARAHSLPYSRAFDYLNKYQALDYIVNFYVENTQTPMRLMLEDMAECCRYERWYARMSLLEFVDWYES